MESNGAAIPGFCGAGSTICACAAALNLREGSGETVGLAGVSPTGDDNRAGVVEAAGDGEGESESDEVGVDEDDINEAPT